MDVDEDFQDPINLHCLATMEGRTSFLGGDDLDDADFVDPPTRSRAAECSDPVPYIDTPEDFFKPPRTPFQKHRPEETIGSREEETS
jgi:hypothetical protein